MNQEILSDFTSLVAPIAGIPGQSITPDQRLTEDLGVDSLALLEIIEAVEERWNVSIPEEDYYGLRTVQDVIQRVEAETAK